MKARRTVHFRELRYDYQDSGDEIKNEQVFIFLADLVNGDDEENARPGDEELFIVSPAEAPIDLLPPGQSIIQSLGSGVG